MAQQTTPVHSQWSHVGVLLRWLDLEQAQPIREVGMVRVLAIGTAYGAEAVKGVLGLSLGPTPTHSWDDAREAVADVVVAALIVLATIAGDPEIILAARLDEVAARVPAETDVLL
ncbi:hypothetical protein [Streptomyces roseolus]